MSSFADVTKFSFSDGNKLVGASNYLIWAFLLEQILREKGLWDLVQPAFLQALSMSVTSSSSPSTGSSQQAPSSSSGVTGQAPSSSASGGAGATSTTAAQSTFTQKDKE